MRLRWATWNLWAIGPSWIERAVWAGDVLEALDADLICLQEVRRDEQYDAGRVLADRLGLHLGRATPVADGWWSARVGEPIAVDNVVLSRWPIADVAVQVLPHTGDGAERRSALHVGIDAPSRLRVVSTQLTSSPLSSGLRVEQVRAIATEVADRRRADEVVLVAGDMNAEPDSDEVRLLCGHKTAPPVPGHVLMDLWRFAADDARGDTWDRANPYVATTHEPSCRIDYLLAGPMPSGRLPRVDTVDRFAVRPVADRWASDHAGVIADLEVSGEG